MSGQALAQSGMVGFSCGQHGMSSAIAAVEARAMAAAGIGAAGGATTSPTIARIGNRRRRISQSFTPSSISQGSGEGKADGSLRMSQPSEGCSV
jgi:hypothetical protein